MDKWIRNYPATTEYRRRIYRPEFYRLNIAIGVVVLNAFLLALNYALGHG